MPFQVHLSSIFGEVISRLGVQFNPQKLKVLTDMLPPKTKRELKAFLGIINYYGKFSPKTVEVCEFLRTLTLAKAEWMWNAAFQMFEAIFKEGVCMKFYNETKPYYIETDAIGFGLGAPLLQTRHNMSCHRNEAWDMNILRAIAFTSKSLNRVEKMYSNIERESLGILYCLEEFHYYCFAREVSIIMDPKPLITIFKKYVATLSQRLQQNLFKNTSVQGQNYIETLTWLIHGRLAVQTEPQWKQRWRNWGHADKCQCHTVNNLCTRVHDIQQAKWGCISRPTPPSMHGMHHTKVARQKRPITMRHKNILDIQRWHGSYWLSSHQGPIYSNTWSIKMIGVKTAAYQSHKHRKNQTISMWINLLDRYVCRNWKLYKKLLYMPSLSANTTKRENNTLQHPWQILESNRFRHVYNKWQKLPLLCKLS